MKPLYLIYAVLLQISFNGLSKGIDSYQIECISFDYEGYITLKVWDSKKGSKYKFDQAKKDALHSVLFVGSSSNNGCPNQPALLLSDIDIANFKLIEKEFFSTKSTWSNFARVSSAEIALPIPPEINDWKVY